MAEHLAQVERLKQALGELRANRAAFSTRAYGQIVVLLLNELRRANTLPPTPTLAGDEVRLVTVMFLDVIDFTRMAEEIDTGDLRSVIGESHARAGRLVAQWDGEIGQFLGDGLLCFFGSQRSRGDDALRAVACALAIQATLEQYANHVFLEHGVDFGARIGISTGRVVVSIDSAGQQKQVALGPAINLAARLQSLADPGGVVIDAATFSRVRSRFDMLAHPAAVLKGFERAVKYYSVVGRTAQTGRQFTSDQLNGLPLRFVGRATEMSRVRATMEQALIERRFHAITLNGEIGIGKSRLLQETLAQSEDLAFTPVVMLGDYEQRHKDYHLLRDWLMSACHITEDTTPDVSREQIMAYITGTWDDPEAPTAAALMSHMAGFGFDHTATLTLPMPDPRVSSSPLPEAVLNWFKATADNGGLLLMVDNLQWADTASVRLLEALARTLEKSPAVLVAAARPGYRQAHPLFLRGVEQATTLMLEPLADEATLKLLEAILGHIERVPDTLRQVILDRAEGNPLFVHEFLSMMFDNGVFFRHASGSWRFNIIQYDSTSLPHGLVEVLQARLDDLNPDARQLILLAAIAGQVFWRGLVAELAGIDPQPLLHTLVQRGMIVRHPDSAFPEEEEYAFRHSLYRDVAYENLPRARRELLHRQVARWLVTRMAERPEFYSVLAEQFEAGGETITALYTWLEAVQNRLNRGMLTEALVLNDRGLALSRNVTRDAALPVVTQLWTLRAQALNPLGRYDEASAASQSALMLLKELPVETQRKTRVVAGQMLARALTSLGRYDEAARTLVEVNEFVNLTDRAGAAALLRASGGLAYAQGNLTASQDYFERAYALLRQSDDHSLGSTLTYLGRIAFQRGDLAAALGYLERVLDANYQRSYRHYQVLDLSLIGQVYLSLMAYDRALMTFDEALTIQATTGIENPLLRAYRALSVMYQGQIDEGLGLLVEATRQVERDQLQADTLQLKFIQGLGMAGETLRYHEQALAFTGLVRSRNPLLYGRGLLELGKALHTLDEPAATTTLEEALKYELSHGGRDVWLCCEALLMTRPPEATRVQLVRQAAAALHRTADGLAGRPDLHYTFLNAPRVKYLLQEAEKLLAAPTTGQAD
ncbi:MAG: AAA family ATPase [Anaerolineae bacterium]|nr:AAA family ATPase [Anaerolineae bacterium]